MNVLIVAAHADDEVLGCGATGATLAADGHHVRACLLPGHAEALGRRPRMVKVLVALVRALARPLEFGAEIDRLTQSLELDIGKTRDLLGWEPPVSAAAGIADVAHTFASGAS